MTTEQAIETFALAAERVLATFLDRAPQLEMESSPGVLEAVADQVMVIVGIGGDLVGRMIFMLDKSSALEFCKALHDGEAFYELDPMARDTLGELANLVAGRAVNSLHEDGIRIAIAPPLVLEGQDLDVSQFDSANVACLSSTHGTLRVNTALCESLQFAKSKERPQVCPT